MSFYPAHEIIIDGRYSKVYLNKDVSLYQFDDVDLLRELANTVYQKNNDVLDHGRKYVILIWQDKNDVMLDWWIWGDDENESAGANIEVYLFRGENRYESTNVTAEDGLRILANETT